jgi:C3HC4-type zinc finger (RING finger) protein
MDSDQIHITLPCGHKNVCDTCLETLMLTLKFKCPLCRKALGIDPISDQNKALCDDFLLLKHERNKLNRLRGAVQGGLKRRKMLHYHLDPKWAKYNDQISAINSQLDAIKVSLCANLSIYHDIYITECT